MYIFFLYGNGFEFIHDVCNATQNLRRGALSETQYSISFFLIYMVFCHEPFKKRCLRKIRNSFRCRQFNWNNSKITLIFILVEYIFIGNNTSFASGICFVLPTTHFVVNMFEKKIAYFLWHLDFFLCSFKLSGAQKFERGLSVKSLCERHSPDNTISFSYKFFFSIKFNMYFYFTTNSSNHTPFLHEFLRDSPNKRDLSLSNGITM